MTKSSRLKLSFTFVSHIPPLFLTNFKFNIHQKNSKTKLFLKQSYILLTWFHHLNLENKKLRNLKFFVLPVKRKIFTLTKAPMAHKNWSKEQYKLQFFFFKITLKNRQVYFFNQNQNHTLLLLLLAKKNMKDFETNLFFLKNFSITFCFSSLNFFNYYLYK